MIRQVTQQDAADICDIYNYYIEQTVISFEEKPVSAEEMQERIYLLLASGFPWLVYETDVDGHRKVVGYAYADTWKTRIAYRFTLETTAYMAPNTSQKGYGSQLYEALFKALETSLVRSVIAVIALPNEASVRFHEKMGYQKAAYFKQVGYKNDQWIDVGYWQKFL